METKICNTCKDNKPLSEYHKNNTKKDGLSSMCKECRKKYIRIHYENNKQYYLDKNIEVRKEISEWFKKLKQTLKCEKCGEDHPACLEFHHINPEEKELEISKLVKVSKKKVIEEIKKCIVLCANCHRKLHHKVDYIKH